MSDAGRQILGLLDRRKSARVTIAEMDPVESSKVEHELDWLRDRGLLFEELGQFMSLVFPEDIRPPAFRDESEPALVPISRLARRVSESDFSPPAGD